MSAADVEPTVPVRFDWDEAYPVFFEDEDDGRCVIQMTAAELARFRDAEKEWNEVQSIIQDRSTYR